MRHLMPLKEVKAKEAPQMTQEESFPMQDVDDAFVLASAARKQGSVLTHKANKCISKKLIFILD